MTALVALIGLVVGVMVGALLLRRASAVRADGLFREWRAEEGVRLSRAAADGTRLASKTGLVSELDGGIPLPFLAADARFLGHPVHLVVFDGDSEVKAGVIDDLRSILFVTVEREAVRGLDDAALVAECLSSGRVRWETVRP